MVASCRMRDAATPVHHDEEKKKKRKKKKKSTRLRRPNNTTVLFAHWPGSHGVASNEAQATWDLLTALPNWDGS